MILTDKILQLIEQKMVDCPYNASYYPVLAPQEATYPLVTATIINLQQDISFDLSYNQSRIQFSVFDDDPSPEI